MRGFRLSRRARADVDEIRAHIARDNPVAAGRMVDRFFDSFVRLASTPGVGRAMPHLGAGDLRVFPVGNYIVFYRRKPNTIEIVRVLHGARNYDSLF